MRMLIGIILLAGCSAAKPAADSVKVAEHALDVRESHLKQRADSIAHLDPVTEARAAIARGDLRLIGLCAYTCFAPGVADSTRRAAGNGAMKNDSLRIIEGTSESGAGPDAQLLAPIAQRFALAYNGVIMSERRRAKH